MKQRKYRYCQGLCIVTLTSTLLMTSGLHAEETLPASETLSERTKEFLSDPSRTGSLVGSILAGAAVANPLAPLLGSVAGFMIGKSSAFTQKDDKDARRQAYANRSLIPADGTQIIGLSGLTGDSPLQPNDATVITGIFGETDASTTSLQSVPLDMVEFPDGTASESGVAAATEIAPPTGIASTLGTASAPENLIKSAHTEQIVIVEPPVKLGMANPVQQTESLVAVELPAEAEIAAEIAAIREAVAEDWSEQTDQTTDMEMAANIEARINLQKQLAYACDNVELAQPLAANCYYFSQ